jgi:seryl-tRNA synthetase
MCNGHWTSNEGLVTLDIKASRLKNLLDAGFVRIARSLDAEPMQFAPLLKVLDVDSLDYFKNFPQLPLVVSSTDAVTLSEKRGADQNSRWEKLDHDCLADASHILPPAACYAVYIHHRDSAVGAYRSVTTAANCFRNETHYIGLKRLKSFSMREIVFIGEMAQVTEALERARERVRNMADRLRIETRMENATDPFFDLNSTRAITQKMFPTKQEMVYGDGLAIASANFHRNFFGERFGISSTGGQVAYTACIGMGLERWIHAILEVNGDDIDGAVASLEEYMADEDAPLEASLSEVSASS